MKQACCPRRANPGGWLRCALLVVAIVLVSHMVVSCAKPSPKPAEEARITDRPAQSIPGRAVQKAMGVECKGNLDQLRSMIEMFKSDNEGTAPATLAELQVSPEVTRCPISHQDYVYDPATGQVSCTFQGHEQF